MVIWIPKYLLYGDTRFGFGHIWLTRNVASDFFKIFFVFVCLGFFFQVQRFIMYNIDAVRETNTQYT